MFVKTRILGESPSTIFNRANIWFLARMNSNMIFIISRTGKSLAAFRLCTFIRTLAGMCSYVNLFRGAYICNILVYLTYCSVTSLTITFTLTFLILLVVKERPQPSNGHRKGRSPVCVRTCFNKSPEVLKLLSQASFEHL